MTGPNTDDVGDGHILDPRELPSVARGRQKSAATIGCTSVPRRSQAAASVVVLSQIMAGDPFRVDALVAVASGPAPIRSSVA